MTREEAIEILNNTSFFAPSMERVDEAIDMAISALSEEEKLKTQLANCHKEILRLLDLNMLTEDENEVVEKNDDVIDHDREWTIGCIKHDGFIKTDRFDKANQIILEALSAEQNCDNCKEYGSYKCTKCDGEMYYKTEPSDLISRADAVAYPLGFDHYDKENGSKEFICGVESYREYIQHLPSVSAERVGEWLEPNNEIARSLNQWICNQCNHLIDGKQNYCPNCGARMENKK